MGSSRTPHSVSSVSSRSYMSSRTRHRSCSSRHSDSSQKPSRKMKFVIAIGIALPIIAAIIGVVAWAISADTASQGVVISSLRRSDINMDNPEEDIFQILENRQDVEFSRHFQMPNKELGKHDFSRLDTDDNHHQFDDNNNKDPLYIVHFVPSPKPETESSSSNPNLVSTVSNDVLQKILSASKGAKPGTPQFVVFAPVPEEGDPKNDEEVGTLPIGSNMLQNKQGTNDAIDYDYEEELRKYQELLDSSDQPPHKETSRVEQPKEQTQVETETIKESVRHTSQNFTSGSVYQSHHHHQTQTPNSNILQAINGNQHQILNQQQSLVPQVNYQQNAQDYSQNPQGIPQEYLQQAIQQLQQQQQQQQQYNPLESNQAVQVYPQQPQATDHQQQYYPQESNQAVQVYPQQPQATDHQQQYYPQESNKAVQVYPQQPQATARSGSYEPAAIKLNFGGGSGLLGGNYSPLGIIASILRPLLPRPQVNLNGKVMFGVMLENGIKFGNRGQHSSYENDKITLTSEPDSTAETKEIKNFH